MSKRCTLILQDSTWERLRMFAREYGFRSVRDVVTALTNMFTDRKATDILMEKEGCPEDDREYIRSMFDELEHWEPEPEAGHAPRRRRRHGEG